MDKGMKYLHYIMPGLTGLSLFSFQKHDWDEGFLDDRWGILGSVSFLVGTSFTW